MESQVQSIRLAGAGDVAGMEWPLGGSGGLHSRPGTLPASLNVCGGLIGKINQRVNLFEFYRNSDFWQAPYQKKEFRYEDEQAERVDDDSRNGPLVGQFQRTGKYREVGALKLGNHHPSRCNSECERLDES